MLLPFRRAELSPLRIVTHGSDKRQLPVARSRRQLAKTQSCLLRWEGDSTDSVRVLSDGSAHSSAFFFLSCFFFFVFFKQQEEEERWLES